MPPAIKVASFCQVACRERASSNATAERATKERGPDNACVEHLPNVETSHLAEVFPAHPEGPVVVVVLVPYGHLRARTARATPPRMNDINTCIYQPLGTSCCFRGEDSINIFYTREPSTSNLYQYYQPLGTSCCFVARF